MWKVIDFENDGFRLFGDLAKSDKVGFVFVGTSYYYLLLFADQRFVLHGNNGGSEYPWWSISKLLDRLGLSL